MGSDFKPYRRRGRPPKNRIEHTAKKLGLPVWVVTVFVIVMIAIYMFVAYNMWLFPFTGKELFNGITLSGNPNSTYAPPPAGDGDGDNDGSSLGGGPGVISGDLSIHFLMLGNKYNGDSTFIKAGDIDILVDAGSRQASSTTLKSYIDNYCTDGVLEYVIVTHSDRDHIAGFVSTSSTDSIFKMYDCRTIIDFPLTNKVYETDSLYTSYIDERDAEVALGQSNGAVRYSALDCYNNANGASRIINLTSDIQIEILYNYYYEHTSSDENNYSVCFMLKHGERNFLFTGDLEEDGEEHLASFYDFPQVELFKGGHHGSPTSSNECLLQEIRPKKVCVCCCAGSTEFTQNPENTFPSQEFINRVSKYTEYVYVTTVAELEYETTDTVSSQVYKYDESLEKYIYVGKNNGGTHKCSVSGYTALNGNIRIISNVDSVTVDCTNNNTKLKDTTWFSENRTMPSYWQTPSV